MEEEHSPSSRLGLGQTLAYSGGELAATFLPMAITSWMMYFYCPPEGKGAPLMGLLAFAVVQFGGKVSDSVSNPLVGYLSDRTRSRWGRRIPYIIFGAPLLAVTTALIWFPPADHPGMANNLWLLVNLVVFWAAYTFIVAPYLALMPEIAPSNEERIKVGAFMAGGDVLGFLLGGGVVGILITSFAGDQGLARLHLDAYKMIFIVSGVLVLVLFWLTWWFVRETPHSLSKEVSFNFFHAVKETMRNPAFSYYLVAITFLNAIRDVAFGLMPYFTKSVLELGEASEMWAGFFQMGILVVAGVSLPLVNWAANRWGKKAVFITGVGSFAVVLPIAIGMAFLPLPGSALKFWCLAGFALMGPGAAAMLTLWRPIISDIIDFDEKITGFRREAMYMGVEGLIGKLGAGLAPVIIAVNLGIFGYVNGVHAAFVMDAALVAVTCLLFVRHPIRK